MSGLDGFIGARFDEAAYLRAQLAERDATIQQQAAQIAMLRGALTIMGPDEAERLLRLAALTQNRAWMGCQSDYFREGNLLKELWCIVVGHVWTPAGYWRLCKRCNRKEWD